VESNPEYIIVGKIGATYGIKGWLKIVSFTETSNGIADYNPWYLEDVKGWKPIKVTETRPHGKGLVAKIDGFDTPEVARGLTGKTIAIKRSQLIALESNEFYWADLHGLTVINQHDEVLGKIIYIIETGSNDVLVVKGSEGDIAIPYLFGETVLSVDLEQQIMKVDWDLL
jgi:16S rRNA processing protein RimM